MSQGYKSMLAFWVGGANAPTFVPPPPTAGHNQPVKLVSVGRLMTKG